MRQHSILRVLVTLFVMMTMVVSPVSAGCWGGGGYGSYGGYCDGGGYSYGGYYSCGGCYGYASGGYASCDGYSYGCSRLPCGTSYCGGCGSSSCYGDCYSYVVSSSCCGSSCHDTCGDCCGDGCCDAGCAGDGCVVGGHDAGCVDCAPSGEVVHDGVIHEGGIIYEGGVVEESVPLPAPTDSAPGAGSRNGMPPPPAGEMATEPPSASPDALPADPLPSAEPEDAGFGEESMFDEPAAPAEAGEEDDMFNGGSDDSNDSGDDDFDDLFPASAQMRTWKDNTGHFSTQAQFVELTEHAVRLLKANGRHCTVPFHRLSAADFELVQKIAAQRGLPTALELAQR